MDRTGTPGSDAPKRPLLDLDASLDEAVEAFLASKEKATGGGAYARTAESVLVRFVEWATSRGIERVDDLDKHALAGYARHLKGRVSADAIAPSTAHTYYDVVGAFCTWAVRRDLLSTNVARKAVALEELPAETGTGDDPQMWSRETAEDLLRWTTWKIDDALANDWGSVGRFVRDRALVAALYFCGVRGAEVLARADDPRRSGLRWRDVDLDSGALPVLGKSQEREHAPLPDAAADFLRSHRRHQQPSSEDWPVFRSGHRPSVADAVWEQLGDRFGPDGRASVVERELMVEGNSIESVIRAHDLVPPPLSTSGARHVLERLSVESGITVDGEPPKPHGARRGLGDLLYRRNPVDAQEALRHRDISTTHESYAGIKAAETSAAIDEALTDE